MRRSGFGLRYPLSGAARLSLPAIGVVGVHVPCMELITIDGNNAERHANGVIQTFAEKDSASGSGSMCASSAPTCSESRTESY